MAVLEDCGDNNISATGTCAEWFERSYIDQELKATVSDPERTSFSIWIWIGLQSTIGGMDLVHSVKKSISNV